MRQAHRPGHGESTLPPLSSLRLIFEALPFGVSWATLPGARIQRSNAAFDRIFGYPPGHFETAGQLIAEAYIHEHQREQVLAAWQDFGLAQPHGERTMPEVEIEILGGDGQFRTLLHWGLMLYEHRIAVGIFRDVSDFKRDRQQLLEYAFRDPLTGLPNRRAFQEWWQQEVDGGSPRPLAFLMVDLDGFKPINDTHGHALGDQVLCLTASRLQAAVREHDLVCRFGGDEFGVLLPVPGDRAQLDAICARIVATLNEPMVVGGVAVRVGASVGGCLYPEPAASKRELLQCADRALYRVKQTGKNGWGWFAA